MQQEFIFAGFGGQVYYLWGQLLAHAAMDEGKKVSWIPSYGPEMPGWYCQLHGNCFGWRNRLTGSKQSKLRCSNESTFTRQI